MIYLVSNYNEIFEALRELDIDFVETTDPKDSECSYAAAIANQEDLAGFLADFHSEFIAQDGGHNPDPSDSYIESHTDLAERGDDFRFVVWL